ncbi:MAG: DNA methyltransferase [Blastopirellula sp.]|nr:MAG: DNA methyltransferase [Blastopirellula sp.]
MKDLLGDEIASQALPPAAWLGGKRKLAKTISKRIATIAHSTYVEPFIGMGGVFFRRPFAAQCEIINDINGDVMNLFRILQRHYPQFMDCLKFQIASRREFESLLKVDASTLTDLERAARFLYLQRLSFGGKVSGQSFGTSPNTPARFNISKLEPMLADVHERLAGVVIENLPWQEVITKYDSPDALFYLDPPYWDGENDYGKGIFAKDDFRRMAKQLAAIEGKFILSINDVPRIREIFEGFDFQEVRLKYSISNSESTEAKELIISN